MNSKQMIPHITPAMFSGSVDQVSKILNELIDEINELRRNK